MPLTAKLDVIDPQERDSVYDLDAARGVVTIGQEPTDDVILESPDSARGCSRRVVPPCRRSAARDLP